MFALVVLSGGDHAMVPRCALRIPRLLRYYSCLVSKY